MYGDTAVMRKHGRTLREQATELRRTADQLVAQSDLIAWTGRAADSMRERIRERSTHLREVAAAHDDAAEALDTHLAEVDRLKDLISQRELRARDLASGTFVAPAPGHRDWLTVQWPEG